MSIRIKAVSTLVILTNSFVLSGCSKPFPKTYPVEGKVKLASGDISRLAGARIEAVLSSDRRIEARGEIQRDGSFALETIQAGKPRTGVPEGEYLVRILPPENDDAAQRRRGVVLAQRLTRYESSGLKFQAPSDSNLTIQVPAR